MRSNLLRALALALAIGFTVAVPTSAAGAPNPNDCATRRIDPTTYRLICEADIEVPGLTPIAATDEDPAPSSSGTPTATWTRYPLPGELCTVPGELIGIGQRYRYTLIDSATGQVLREEIVCVSNSAPADAPPPAPLPPAPPTREELLDATPIPQPIIEANPSGRGLTGLESWFWAGDSGAVTAAVTLRGWTVSGTLTADSWTWTTGDGGRYEVSTPGSPEDPAVRHLWETKDTWSVTLEVSWSGSYTVSGFGTTLVVDGLVAEDSTTVDYPVVEVRAVLDDEPNRGAAG